MRGIKRNQLKYDCYDKPYSKKSHKRVEEQVEEEEYDEVEEDDVECYRDTVTVDVPIVMLTPKFDAKGSIAEFRNIPGNAAGTDDEKGLPVRTIFCDSNGWQQIIGPESTTAFAVGATKAKSASRKRRPVQDDAEKYSLFVTNNIVADASEDNDTLTFTMFFNNSAKHLGTQAVLPFTATFDTFWEVYPKVVLTHNDKVHAVFATVDSASHITFDWDGKLAWNASKKLEFDKVTK